MKKLPSFLLALVALAPAAVFAASFEGRVAMNMISPKTEPVPVAWSLKEGFSRMDMSAAKGQTVSMIMDLTKQEMIILMDSEKMYMVRPIPKPDAQPERKTAARDDVTFEKTGITEKILGYTCEKYLVKSKDGTSELWVTDQLGTFMGMGSGANPMGGRRASSAEPQAWEKALMGKNFFPLRTVVLDKSGKESFRMEATAVEKKSLPASMFAPPAGYEKFDMGGMMKGMMKGMIPGGN
jgi:Domain of unknown function (DUF4412)